MADSGVTFLALIGGALIGAGAVTMLRPAQMGPVEVASTALPGIDAPSGRSSRGGDDAESGAVGKCKADNELLQLQVSDLTKRLEEESKKCDLKGVVADAVARGEEQKAAAQKRLEEERRALSQKSQQLATKARSGTMKLEELESLLHGKLKEEVVAIMGNPDNVKKPAKSDEYSFEIWSYKEKVFRPESNARRALIVYFSGDKAARILSSD